MSRRQVDEFDREAEAEAHYIERHRLVAVRPLSGRKIAQFREQIRRGQAIQQHAVERRYMVKA